ncbi:peptidase M16 inactive domain-containing protein [Cryptosporidium felis]|nr:peptidase M16 inactive domain-containing protein [Cryptosporidium felis]
MEVSKFWDPEAIPKPALVSFIEVITDENGKQINNFDIGDLVYMNITDIDETEEHITFDDKDAKEIQDLKEKLHAEEELAKLKESGKKCLFGMDCLYGLDSMDSFINTTTSSEVEHSLKNPTRIEDRQFKKYPGDENKYRFIKLENGLKVFLLSNSLLYTSSLTLGIEVGSAHDPVGVDGVSFLLTQELFKKKENTTDGDSDFRKLLDDNNGYFNVDSRPFSTLYSYNIKSKFFQSSFSAFLKRLLKSNFSWESLDRSISETSEMASLFSEVGVLQERQLKRSLSNPLHSFHRFPYGTNETLREIPLKNNISIHEEVIKFKRRYYSPHLMVLSIATSLSLDTVEELVRKGFSTMVNTKSTPATPLELSGNVTHPYDTLVGKFLEVSSRSPEGYVTLEFPIPTQNRLWRFKLVSYIRYFLVQRFYGSFLNSMGKNGWIRDVEVEVFNSDTGFSNLVVKIILVDSNRSILVRVLQGVFGTLNAIKTAKYNKYLVEQIRRVEQGLLKQFKSTGYYRYSKNIVVSLLETKCSPENVLVVPYELEEVDYKYIKLFFEYINPYNMAITFSTNSFERNSRDFLLSSKVYGESGWGTFSRKFKSFFRRFGRLFKRAKPGEYPVFKEEKFLHAKYLISDIPKSTLELLENSKAALAQDFLGFNITEIAISYPKLYTIYTYDTPPQVHPQLLVESLASYIKYTSNTTEEIDETLMNKVLSGFNEFVSPMAYSTFYYPINVGIPKLAINSRFYIQPKSLVAYGFQSLPKVNAKLVTLSYLFMKSFKYALAPEFQNGVVDWNFNSTSELQNSFLGIEFRWTNYTSSFDDFFSGVLNGLRKYESLVSKSHLGRAKSDFESMLNRISKPPAGIIAEDTSFYILNFYVMKISMFSQALRSIQLKDIINFASYVIKVGSMESLVIGNCTPMQVNSYLIKIARILNRDFSATDSDNLRFLNNTGIDRGTEGAAGGGEDTGKGEKIEEPGKSSIEVSKAMFNMDDSGEELTTVSVGQLRTNAARRISVNNFSERSFLPEGNYKGKWINRVRMETLPEKYQRVFYLTQCSNQSEDRSVVHMEVQVGDYSEEMLAFLQLVANLNIKATFKSFVSSEYPETEFEVKPFAIGTSYLLLKLIVSSAKYSVIKLTSLAVQFYNKYFAMVTPMISKDEFKKAVNKVAAGIEIPHTDLDELLDQYSSSLLDRKSDPNWKYTQVAYLLNLNYNEFLYTWGIFVKPAILTVSVLKTHISAIEQAEANSFELEGFSKLNSTSLIKKIAVENNLITL